MAIEKRQLNPPTDEMEQAREWARCAASPLYFIEAYSWIFNVNAKRWMPFEMWPAQRWALVQIHGHPLTVILKARQLGFTWMLVAYALWLMIFCSPAGIAVFSRIETDAQDLLVNRMKEMYARLPGFMQADGVTIDNKSEWRLSIGSYAMAFATTGGRQYTFSYVLVDEADFQPDLDSLMLAIEPTITAGGGMALLSTSDKSSPESRYKQIYRAAKGGKNEWEAIFLPWYARPSRTIEWYENRKRNAESTTGSLDDVHQEFPATDTEALAARTLDKRIPMPWIEQCFEERQPLRIPRISYIDDVDVDDPLRDCPPIHSLVVYAAPVIGERYVIGIDPAEGNPTSDDSALTVMNRRTGEEVAVLAGKFQPAIIAGHAASIGMWFNHADVLAERNNHGHAVLLWLLDYAPLRVLDGHDDRPGWLSSTLGKTLLYDQLADGFRDKATTLHSFDTYTQIASIEGSSLRAPEGLHDDLSDSYALAHVARSLSAAADRLGDDIMVHDEDVRISAY